MPKIEIRCTEEEKTAWQRKAEQAGLSLSALVRASLDKARLPDQRRAAELARLTREVAKIGNNLNQIARFANTYKTDADAAQIIAHLAALESEVESVYKSLSAR
jgi:hypothetical protein